MTNPTLTRFRSVDCARFVYDQAAITRAFRHLLVRAGLPVLPLAWMKDFQEGIVTIITSQSNATHAAWSTAWGDTRNALWGEKSALWGAAENAAWEAAEKTAWSTAWNTAFSAAWSNAWSTARRVASEPEGVPEQGFQWSLTWNTAFSSTWRLAWSTAWNMARKTDWREMESAKWRADWSHTEGDTESAAFRSYLSRWVPLFRAYEAGLWIFWMGHDKIYVIPRPVLRVQQLRLHAEGGPAVFWPNSTERYYFLHGVQVEAWMANTPEQELKAVEVLRIPNVEQRREVIRRVGVDRMVASLPHQVLDRAGTYTLLRVSLGEGHEDCRYLKMLSPSLPGVWHVEGVHPSCETIVQALNFRRYGDHYLKEVQPWNPTMLT